MTARRTRWIGIIAAIGVIVVGLGLLVFGQMENNLVYFVTPSELLAKGSAAIEQSVRLGGMVKAGSIEWDAKAPSLRFLLTDGTQEIPVTAQTTPPQMFQEEMGVIVEGRLRGDQQFVAERLMVKHSNEYRPPDHGQKPAVIYKDLVHD